MDLRISAQPGKPVCYYIDGKQVDSERWARAYSTIRKIPGLKWGDESTNVVESDFSLSREQTETGYIERWSIIDAAQQATDAPKEITTEGIDELAGRLENSITPQEWDRLCDDVDTTCNDCHGLGCYSCGGEGKR